MTAMLVIAAGGAIGFLLGFWTASAMIGAARREECDLCCIERMELCKNCEGGRVRHAV